MPKRPRTTATTSGPADRLETWPIGKIREYPKNVVAHSDEQVEQIAASIDEFGVTTALLVDEDGELIYGHARLRAMKKRGIAKAPVFVARGWSEDKKRAYRIADNQLGRTAPWDVPMLHTELVDLRAAEFDLSLLGFEPMDLSAYLDTGPAAANPENAPELPTEPTSRRGDVWLLGQHRLIVGDATEARTWDALCGEQRGAMVFTDPPYGVSYQGGDFDVIEGDDKRDDALYQMLLASMRHMVRYAADDAAFYIWHASATREDYAQAMKAAGLVERQYLIWAKPSIAIGHADYQWQHEPCFYSSKDGRSPAFYGQRTESTVWHAALSDQRDTAIMIGSGLVLADGEGAALYVQVRAPKNKKVRSVRLTRGEHVFLSGSDRCDGTVWQVDRDAKYQHPTQKPVALARRAIENSSRPGEIVVDCYLGSGTVLVAAQQVGRRCFGVEIDPTYADVCIHRFANFVENGYNKIMLSTNNREIAFEEVREMRKNET